jgi:RimJ/RimL family protein N-acetyltransferase
VVRAGGKRLLHIIARDYWNGYLYVIEPDAAVAPHERRVHCEELQDIDEAARSPHEELRRQAWTRDTDTEVFGAWVGRELAAICWFQARETYRRRGGLFDLKDDEAELAQVTTALTYRGQGIAGDLIRYGVSRMGALGFNRLYAKIWHDNVESLRAFERAGWRRQKRFVAIRLRGARRPLVFLLPKKRV